MFTIKSALSDESVVFAGNELNNYLCYKNCLYES